MSPTLLKIAHEENGRVLRFAVDCGEKTPKIYRALLAGAPALEALTPDTVLDADTLAALADADARYTATVKALRLLANSDHSARALARKLHERGIEREMAESVAAEMRESGYIREKDQAYRLAVTRANKKCWGPRRILADLVNKGYPASTVRKAIAQAEEEGDVDFEEIKARLFAEKLPETATGEDKRKLLWKQGF